jgi:hypothetical protein
LKRGGASLYRGNAALRDDLATFRGDGVKDCEDLSAVLEDLLNAYEDKAT